MNTIENAVEYFKKVNTKISFELTASEATDIRIALSSRMSEVLENDKLDYETKKVNVDYYQSLYTKFVTE